MQMAIPSFNTEEEEKLNTKLITHTLEHIIDNLVEILDEHIRI